MTGGAFYVYAYMDGDAPIYVGKGIRDRAASHMRAAARGRRGLFYDRLRALAAESRSPRIAFIAQALSDEDALKLEADLIARHGRFGLDRGGILLNRHAGGGQPPNHKGRKFPDRRAPSTKGLPGKRWTDEQREAHRLKMTAVMACELIRSKVSAAKTGKPGPVMSLDARAKIGAALRGRSSEAKSRSKTGASNPNFGRRWFTDGDRSSLHRPGSEPAGWQPGRASRSRKTMEQT